MRRILWPTTMFLSAVTFTAMIVGCGGGADDGTGPIKIGHYASLTGAEATFGQSTDKGIQLAVKERNAAGGVKGRQVELVTYDDQGKSQEVATVVTRLITSDRVKAIIGEVASSRSIVGGTIAQKYGVPMVTPSSTNPKVTEIGPMVFRVCFIDSFQGDVAAKFATERGWKKGAVLYDKTQAYSTGLGESFKLAFEKLGGKIVTEQAYSGGDSNFNAQLTTIRSQNPDVIFVPGYYTDIGTIALQVRSLGIEVPMLGGDGWDSSELAKNAGKAINGSFYTNHYSHQEDREAVKTFVTKYQEEFDAVPDGLAALGYDAANILFDAMDRAPSGNGKDIAAALAATKDFQAVTGSITIDENRNAQKAAVVLGIQGFGTALSDDHQSLKGPTRPMTDFLQTLVSGLALGSLYALIALGYTLVYGTLKFINFAHGDVFTIGAWSSLLVAAGFGWVAGGDPPPLYASVVIIIAAILICGVLGFLIERIAYKPLRSAPRLNVLITAIGVSLLLQNAGQLDWIFGARPRTMPNLLPFETIGLIAGVKIQLVEVVSLSLSVSLMLALEWLIHQTRIGRAMRAVSFNHVNASLMGINVDGVISFTFVLGAMLAGAAGFLYSMMYPVLNQPAHQTWVLLGLKAFIAAVVGGIGNVRGAMLGGFLIGLVELLGTKYISTEYRDVYVFSLLIMILLVRPSGLFGKSTVEKV